MIELSGQYWTVPKKSVSFSERDYRSSDQCIAISTSKAIQMVTKGVRRNINNLGNGKSNTIYVFTQILR